MTADDIKNLLYKRCEKSQSVGVCEYDFGKYDFLEVRKSGVVAGYEIKVDKYDLLNELNCLYSEPKVRGCLNKWHKHKQMRTNPRNLIINKFYFVVTGNLKSDLIQGLAERNQKTYGMIIAEKKGLYVMREAKMIQPKRESNFEVVQNVARKLMFRINKLKQQEVI